MRNLKNWIDSKGIEQAGYPFCLFFDNPGKTSPSQLRSEACIPIGRPFETEGDYKMEELGEVEVAEMRNEGPPGDYGKTYGLFLEGLLREGFRLLGPAREYFMSVSEVKGPGWGFLIQQPVAKK